MPLCRRKALQLFGLGPGVLSLGATVGLGYALLRSYLRGKRPTETTVESG
mgnify:CR=1 FL=1